MGLDLTLERFVDEGGPELAGRVFQISRSGGGSGQPRSVKSCQGTGLRNASNSTSTLLSNHVIDRQVINTPLSLENQVSNVLKHIKTCERSISICYGY